MSFAKYFIFYTLFLSSVFVFPQKPILTFNYKQIDSITDLNITKFKEINISNIDFLSLNDCKLDEIEKDINYLAYFGFENYFDFKNQDQILVFQKIINLKNQINQSRIIIDQYLSNLDFWYFKQSQDLLITQDTVKALYFLDKSLNYNKLFIPALSLKSSILISQNEISKASSLFKDIVPFISIDYNGYLQFITSAMQIVTKYKSETDLYYKSGYYNESLSLYQSAFDFCSTFKGFECQYFFEGILKSKKGLYLSFLKIATQALNTNNYSIAESFTDKALEFATQNRAAIETDIETNNIYSIILSKYIDLSKRNSNTTLSNIYSKKAKRICDLLKYEDCNLKTSMNNFTNNENVNVEDYEKTDIAENTPKPVTPSKPEYKTIKPKIKKINYRKTIVKKSIKNIHSRQFNNSNNFALYKNLLEIGNEFYLKSNYESAYTKYIAAKSFKKSLSYKEIDIVDSLILNSVRKIVSAPIADANFLLWNKQFDRADSLLQIAYKLQKSYGVENDLYITSVFDKLHESIFKQKCNAVQDTINNLNLKIKNLITLLDFDRAIILCNEITEIFSENSKCVLDDYETIKNQIIIKPIINYFSLIEAAREFYKNDDYIGLIYSFNLADSLYLLAKLDTLKIKNNNLISFLNFKNNEKANLIILDNLINNQDYNYALQLLNLLKINGYQSLNTKKYQNRIAKILSVKKNIDMEFLKHKYIFLSDEKWFKYFINDYKKMISNVL